MTMILRCPISASHGRTLSIAVPACVPLAVPVLIAFGRAPAGMVTNGLELWSMYGTRDEEQHWHSQWHTSTNTLVVSATLPR